jgi:hypothetical protein
VAFSQVKEVIMATNKPTEISVLEVTTCRMSFCLAGLTPIILNRLSQKAKGQLLDPAPKKNAAEKASTRKHEPLMEFRASPYLSPEEDSPTLLRHLSTAFKGALRSAALDIPGANKSQVGRLTYVNGEYINLFGIPKLLMSVTRSADMNRTPDIRTRAIIPHWACQIDVTFVTPLLKEQTVANLLAAAGIMQGVGDWRPGKGSGTYGQFRLTTDDDPEFKAIIKSGGRKAQTAAMQAAEPYDQETEELLAWYDAEGNRRGFKAVA